MNKQQEKQIKDYIYKLLSDDKKEKLLYASEYDKIATPEKDGRVWAVGIELSNGKYRPKK